ncbi:MAG: alanine--tRNA ligase, partial [Ruminiclostridium sp.]|nr:alanine--tRNA ligase [Ruminiclostridium sp.]
AGDCDRIIEIWNLVFTQFDNDGKGNYTQLATKNIDTGMGLERLACVMQGVDNMFEVDTIRNIIERIAKVTGKHYGENAKEDVSIRVITDHVRATTFMAGDGVRPSNEGRGYVFRRLLRRAARHGRLLGVTKPFLTEIVDQVIEENKNAYPELAEKSDYIKKVIATEEESFNKTVEKGMQMLSEMIEKLGENGVLSGDDAFRLHDTYGFPLDLTKEILEEKGLTLDEERFLELMKNQKLTARANRSFKGGWDDAAADALSGLKTTFVGYKELAAETKILALLKDGKPVDSADEGDDTAVVIETTPFYAESGGQVGDKGTIESGNGDNVLEVLDTKKIGGGQFVCYCRCVQGSFLTGDSVTAKVNAELRAATARNHTAAHLLQAALREVLGSHVHQAGSYVDPTRCRFDFSHFSAVTPDELSQIEALVNREILAAVPVVTEELPIEEAKKRGAMALFGEKYGEIVRVVTVTDGYSTEFCGGTHLDNTAKAGLFKIISETSVASGVRRIEATTGAGVLELLNESNRTVRAAAEALKLANPSALVQRCEAIQTELSETKKELERLGHKLAASAMGDITAGAAEVNGVKLFTAVLEATGDSRRKTGDELKAKYTDFIAVLAGKADGKANLLCVCDKGAVEKGANAGQIVKKIAAIAGGKGGGRPDSAMAGIADLSKIDEALAALPETAKEMIK